MAGKGRSNHRDAARAEETVAAAFDGKAGSYQLTRHVDPAFQEEERRILQMLGTVPGLILEVGCGVGVTSLRLAHDGWKVIATDLSLEMLMRVRENSSRTGTPLVGVVRCDVQNLPFRAGTLHAILSHGVLEYVPDIPASVREMERAMEPGGFVVTTIPNRLAPARWIGLLLGLVSRFRAMLARRTVQRVTGEHLYPWRLDNLCSRSGLVKREGAIETFSFLPLDYFPRRLLTICNRIVSALPRVWLFRWWGTQYIARYDKAN